MSDDGEIERLTEIERITNGKPSYFDMDAAFCARIHAAIAAGWKARRLVSSRRLEPEIQNTFPQNKWYASRRGSTFSLIGQGHCVEVAARPCVLKGMRYVRSC